jgi:hypothetical protein
MKAWLKGGLIGGIIGLIAGYWMNVCSEFTCIPALPFSIGNIIILAVSGPAGPIFYTTSVPRQEMIGLIFNIFFYILIGIFIGKIVGKFKNKNQEVVVK